MVLWGISFIFFLAETWYSFSKSSLSKYKFGEISTEQSKVTVEPTTLRCGKNPISFSYKSTEDLSPMTLKSDAKFKKNWLVVSKITSGIWWIFTRPLKVRICHFNGLFLCKVYEVWAKKDRGVIFHDTEQWCKIWINPDLMVSKMAWGIGWTFIRAPKSLKIVHWWALFIECIYCFS